MFNWFREIMWIQFGINFYPLSHHACIKCQMILFCPQSNIKTDIDNWNCKYDGLHDDYEVNCNCMRVNK